MNADQKSLETVFLIAIGRQSGEYWQSKAMYLNIFSLPSSLVLTFSTATYLVCFSCTHPGGHFMLGRKVYINNDGITFLSEY